MCTWTASQHTNNGWCVCQKQTFATWNQICFERSIIACYALLKAIIRFISVYRLSFGYVCICAIVCMALLIQIQKVNVIKIIRQNIRFNLSERSSLVDGLHKLFTNQTNRYGFVVCRKNCIKQILHPCTVRLRTT